MVAQNILIEKEKIDNTSPILGKEWNRKVES